jgi:hypothetical protein
MSRYSLSDSLNGQLEHAPVLLFNTVAPPEPAGDKPKAAAPGRKAPRACDGVAVGGGAALNLSGHAPFTVEAWVRRLPRADEGRPSKLDQVRAGDRRAARVCVWGGGREGVLWRLFSTVVPSPCPLCFRTLQRLRLHVERAHAAALGRAIARTPGVCTHALPAAAQVVFSKMDRGVRGEFEMGLTHDGRVFGRRFRCVAFTVPDMLVVGEEFVLMFQLLGVGAQANMGKDDWVGLYPVGTPSTAVKTRWYKASGSTGAITWAPSKVCWGRRLLALLSPTFIGLSCSAARSPCGVGELGVGLFLPFSRVSLWVLVPGWWGALPGPCHGRNLRVSVLPGQRLQQCGGD